MLEQNSLDRNVTILLEKLCSKQNITNACVVCFKMNIFYLPEKLSVNIVEMRAISYVYQQPPTFLWFYSKVKKNPQEKEALTCCG